MNKENNNKDRFLESASGFMMPFACKEDEDVVCTLLYGEQTHPKTGQSFFHKGMDFVAPHIPLFAVASGVVVAVGNDAVHDNYIICRYGKYEVKYGHIDRPLLNYGVCVIAGQEIAISGDFLHLGVKFDGVDIDPKEFIVMLITNIMQLEAMGIKTFPQHSALGAGVGIKTAYDKDYEEILQLMMQYMAVYLNDIRTGAYTVPRQTDQSLRNIFAHSADKNYFFESAPDLSNPLGLGNRAIPMVTKVQNTIIGDFLNYMALRHNKYISSWDEAQKKNFMSKQVQLEQ